MNLADKDLEAIRAAALPVEYGKITITAGTSDHLDIIVENRLRLPKEPEKTGRIACQTKPNTAKLRRTQ